MHRRTLAILAGLGAATFIAAIGVSVVMRGTGAPTTNLVSRSDLTRYVADAASASDRGLRLHGQLRGLMANDDFRADAAELRDRHQAAMEAWWDKYGDEPRADAAVAALEKLREVQHSAMNALLEEYGVDATSAERAREAAEQARDELRNLMGDKEFRSDLNALRGKYEAAMGAWWDKYGDGPRGDAARSAMRQLRDDAQADMRKLLEEHGVDLPDGANGMLGGFLGRGMILGLGGNGGHRGGLEGMGPGGSGCLPGATPSAPASPAVTQSL